MLLSCNRGSRKSSRRLDEENVSLQIQRCRNLQTKRVRTTIAGGTRFDVASVAVRAQSNAATPRPFIRHTYTRLQMAAGQLPATEEGRLVLHSYSPNGGWYVLMSPGMYNLSGEYGTNHFSPYSYNRHVPLAFIGSAFVPGTYHDRVAPVDLAATLASLLRVNQPSAAAGHVLTQAIDPHFDNGRQTPRAAVHAEAK